jgi:hypothetical protein
MQVHANDVRRIEDLINCQFKTAEKKYTEPLLEYCKSEAGFQPSCCRKMKLLLPLCAVASGKICIQANEITSDFCQSII